MSSHAYRLAPTASRQRGLPAIGFEMTAPGEVELTPLGKGGAILRCRERTAPANDDTELARLLPVVARGPREP